MGQAVKHLNNAQEIVDGQPRVGLVGFGGFGRLVARELAPQCALTICDPAYSRAVLPDGKRLTLQGLAEVAQCDVIILAVPVARMEHVCRALSPHLRPGTVVMDVGSVKVAPLADMHRHLPAHVDILGTHPLFGPQSAANGVAGRKIALCPIRGTQWRRIGAFLRKAGLDVIVTTAEQHDRDMAMVQGLTHLIGKVITDLGPLPDKLTTASFDLLREAVDMVQDDPPTVLHAIEVCNPFAREVRSAFFEKAEQMRDHFERETLLVQGQRMSPAA
ncbi:prephenate dehydrogenase/arogenate dehydrogenase family protein [Shimia sp. MMG029]|uniref:prephenate dehydrogenase/arogenate dehydrogenase family protein n=1 Tax=Shimia sp. MMG029 TaxID=3021978 RepID=UPI0022FEEFC1|nr:prephenate dehydrogenase/arogenate dehydrogenase family protein [Shimia sp. MMG029]MDA5556413.1 prephenate dehydrogenase/arogenate dehydrogenase family protein [Shimia sp. MMG029]